MKNISIAKKLIISFAVVMLLFGGLLASIVTLGMHSISANFKEFYDGPYQTVYTADNLSKSLHAFEKYLLMMITTDDRQAAEEYNAEYTAVASDITADIAFLQDHLTLQADKDLLNGLIENSSAGLELNDKMASLYNSSALESAKKLYFSDYVSSAQASRDLSDQLIESARTVADQYYANAVKAQTQSYLIIIICCAIIIVFVIFIVIYIIRITTRPIQEIEVAMQHLAEGKLDTDVKYVSKDEIGVLSNSVRTMVSNLKAYIRNIDFVIGSISKGNLNIGVEVDYKNDFAPIKDSLLMIIESLNQTLSQIGVSAQQVSAGAEQVSSGAQMLSQGSTD